MLHSYCASTILGCMQHPLRSGLLPWQISFQNNLIGASILGAEELAGGIAQWEFLNLLILLLFQASTLCGLRKAYGY